jgi:predicted nucleic acid-binding protein
VIFLDSNIPMYMVGEAHPNKEATRAILSRMTAMGEVLVTDAEVLQEILHRYVSIRRLDAVAPAMDALLDVASEVFPLEREDVAMAAAIVQGAALSARDAVHVAVMRRRGIARILTFDRGFDGLEDIERISG